MIVLCFIITWILLQRGSNNAQVTTDDICLIHVLKENIQTDLAVTIYDNMLKETRLECASLPYAFFISKVKEEEKDSKGKSVHQDSLEKHEELRPGIPVRFNKKLWVVKELITDGLIQIESPFSRRIKKVNRKLLKISWCEEGKDDTKIKDVT
ncbi:hypothetical protein LR48_Vigan02g071900 [Vigna angularis]|uniref:Uncharacterized protein n=1 Tax=Phaseolus angularis TaxID=3914 RepID=A0A0L9TWM0_PHAAN|nr:hypothetical protein LR48_Vigan02g071900 [Vigna angularis]